MGCGCNENNTEGFIVYNTNSNQGNPGPPGPTGFPGSNSNTGATGPTGPTGTAGSLGPTGATGTSSNTGATGSIGSIGPTGPIGSIGATGTPGVNSNTGATGSIGATGPIGATEATGATGATGVKGATGETGPTGPTGVIGGATGVIGATGSIGVTGSIGATGEIGITGITGTSRIGFINRANPIGSQDIEVKGYDMSETPENWQALGGETGYNALSRNILITELSIPNTVFEYDFYGTFICNFNTIGVNSLAGYFGIKLGNYDLISGDVVSDRKQMLGIVLVSFNRSTFDNNELGHFRYKLTFTIRQVTGSTILFNTAVNFSLDLQAGTTVYTSNQQRFSTSSDSFDFSTLTVSPGFTRLSPCFIPTTYSAQYVTGPTQFFIFTKVGHTFIQIA